MTIFVKERICKSFTLYPTKFSYIKTYRSERKYFLTKDVFISEKKLCVISNLLTYIPNVPVDEFVHLGIFEIFLLKDLDKSSFLQLNKKKKKIKRLKAWKLLLDGATKVKPAQSEPSI